MVRHSFIESRRMLLAAIAMGVGFLVGCGDRGSGAGPDGADDGAGGTSDKVPDDAAGRYAAARCGAMFRCDCSERAYVDEVECRKAVEGMLQAGLDAMAGLAVKFDLDCFEDTLDAWRGDTYCGDLLGAFACSIFTGSGAEGAVCSGFHTTFLFADDCSSELSCQDGVCRYPMVLSGTQEEGELCNDVNLLCIGGLKCDVAAGSCGPGISVGGSCVDSRECVEGAYCRLSDVGGSVCAPLVPLGSACSQADACEVTCQSGTCTKNACRNEVCKPPEAPACGIEPALPY